MTLASLQDRTVLRDLICDISQQCFNKLREQVSGVDLGNLMTPSLLSAQLIMQSALHQIPRVRPVLDDIMLHDIGVLVRKIVVELIENEEGSFDGALKVSDALKGCNYLEAAGIWQIKFILRSAGLEDDAVAIRAVPDIIIWGTALAKQVALGILNSPLRLQRKSRNQELDLQDDNVLLIDDVNGNSIDAIPISQEVVEQNVDSPPSPRLSRPKPKKGRKSRPISRKK